MAATDAPILIKKYANRRLYNTQTSTYITLDDLADLIRSGEDFKAEDAKTKADITHSVLMQVVFDEETQKQSLLPNHFLRRLIALYHKTPGQALPAYLDLTMHMFTRKQDALEQSFAEHSQEEKTPRDKAQIQALLKKVYTFLDVSSPEPAPVVKDETQEQIQALKDQVRKLNEELERARQGAV